MKAHNLVCLISNVPTVYPLKSQPLCPSYIPAIHDAAEPLIFIIREWEANEDGDVVLFATDTEFIPYGGQNQRYVWKTNGGKVLQR